MGPRVLAAALAAQAARVVHRPLADLAAWAIPIARRLLGQAGLALPALAVMAERDCLAAVATLGPAAVAAVADILVAAVALAVLAAAAVPGAAAAVGAEALTRAV